MSAIRGTGGVHPHHEVRQEPRATCGIGAALRALRNAVLGAPRREESEDHPAKVWVKGVKDPRIQELFRRINEDYKS